MTDDGKSSYGMVRIGDQSIGIPLASLSEVFHSRKQQPLPIASDQLQGGIDLRGTLVPVMNLALIGRFSGANLQSRLGVVLEHEGMSLAFHVDEVLGITEVSHSEINQLVADPPEENAFFSSVFSFNGAFVSILNVAAVYAIAGVFSAKSSEVRSANRIAKGPPMLSFTAGGALYSIPAVIVHAAVPRQPIHKSSITSGPCLGEILYHDRRIPIVCPVTIFGLGQSQAPTVSEIVVLRFDDDMLLGLAVDAICEIRTYATARDQKMPEGSLAPKWIERVLSREDGEQVFVIDTDALCAAPVLQDIAALSRDDTEDRPKDQPPETESTQKTLIHERQQYIVLQAHERVAAPILQVTSILEKPQNLTPVSANSHGLIGYFSNRGETLPLMDLRERLGAAMTTSDAARVLIVSDGGSRVGLLIDQVVGIEVSEWRSTEPERASKLKAPLVKLGSGKSAEILPVLDLTAFAQLEYTAPVTQAGSI